MIRFQIFDDSRPPIVNSPSPFVPTVWRELLRSYPGDLPNTLYKVLQYGALVGYVGPAQRILSKNHSSVSLLPKDINAKLREDLALGRIAKLPVDTAPNLFICSPLGLVPKKDGSLRRIHDLSYPRQSSVNAHIDPEFATLSYTRIEDILRDVIEAGRHCVILKRDIKDAFRNIPLSSQVQWLLGFQWEGQLYMERCLPFGLATAPFIFNLFAEGFHWILQSWLGWDLLSHYLDDFISVVPNSPSLDATIQSMTADYIEVTDLLGIPRKDSKDICGTVLPVLGHEVDTNMFTLKVPDDKLVEAQDAAAQALSKASLSLSEAQSLAGFLGFCAPAVQLGRVFVRSLWIFIAEVPNHSSKFLRRRIHADLHRDLLWWRDLLPLWNGVCFFDTSCRKTFCLYTDASGIGLGGYYMPGSGPFTPSDIPLANAFAVPLSRPPQSSTAPFDINIFEMEAINFALQTWGPVWASSVVRVFTDNKTSELGLIRQTLRSPSNYPLRQALLQAAALDIVLEPIWIPGSSNTLADALSRFDYVAIANLCPHWQDFSFLTLQQRFTPG